MKCPECKNKMVMVKNIIDNTIINQKLEQRLSVIKEWVCLTCIYDWRKYKTRRKDK